MPALILTPAQRKAHRAAAHHLDPVVMIGADGLTPAVTKEADAALRAHGLIKVRVLSDSREIRQAALADLCEQLNAAPVQHIGKLLVLWRPRPDKDTVRTEADSRQPGPRIVKILKVPKSGNQRPTIQKVRVMGNERVTAGGSIKRAKARQTSIKKKMPE